MKKLIQILHESRNRIWKRKVESDQYGIIINYISNDQYQITKTKGHKYNTKWAVLKDNKVLAHGIDKLEHAKDFVEYHSKNKDKL